MEQIEQWEKSDRRYGFAADDNKTFMRMMDEPGYDVELTYKKKKQSEVARIGICEDKRFSDGETDREYDSLG